MHDESDDPGFDLLAASLRADRADAQGQIDVLAAKLEGALPGHCEVRRRRRRLLSKETRVQGVAVQLGNRLFLLARHGRELMPTVESTVHDMRRKREELTLDAWLAQLEAELREQARSSAEARAALERLLER